MEILDIPPKLQQAILNPDKRLTVDLRVSLAAMSCAQGNTQAKGLGDHAACGRSILAVCFWRAVPDAA